MPPKRPADGSLKMHIFPTKHDFGDKQMTLPGAGALPNRFRPSPFPRLAKLAAFAVAACLSVIPAAHAIDIERVVSPGGIEAWLVTEPAIPLLSMSFAFRGGASQDPEALPGVSELVSGLLDEGAGELDSQTFQERLRDNNVELSFSASRDAFYGSMRTLSENRDTAFDLLRLALTEPRFDEDALERIRAQAQSRLLRELQDPNAIAGRRWSEIVFGDHPYSRPVQGTVESVGAINRDELRAYHERNFARDNLYVAVVGDIRADELAALLDEVFGDLPETADLRPVPEAQLLVEGEEIVIPMTIPQTVVRFGREGLKRDDDDFMAALVVNHILGGGSFTSRLFREVREQRGLVYSVFTALQTLDEAGVLIGGLATRNERAGEALGLVRENVARMAAEGPTAEELESAKRFLTGSYALRFDNSGGIASQLLQIQIEDLGIDYVNIRNDLVEALTMEDVQRAAQRLLGDGSLTVTLVGQPEGIESVEGGAN
jgi:zinc protease